ncbi:hypothetical protein [Noviherbaspirillum galbum]|uniref:Uncharacterized protein n=1 Tax=Noviherbaspirillum galbum TaxID=2709383 RepID=A0A6B3STL8_9BURK|nr:hypothetical protein [Noviherbaspirillum galbum]NEX64014.1 hypothetical protein [Noviherbaspirillum galbum]
MRLIIALSGLAAASCLLAPPTACAQMQALDDSELALTSGQGLLELTNSSANGFDFSRISLGADVALNANFRNMRWGEYSYPARNGSGADIDIAALQFGRSDGTAAQRVVQITNPYFEVVYRNGGNAATREIVGMRFGFDSIAGDIGLKLNTLSGSMLIDGGAAGTLDSRGDPGGGKRWDGACTGTCLNFNQVGAIRAGDANGPSRDFWMAVLKTPVQFAAPNPAMPLPDVAQAGFWMNWRDRLTALNATGALPPNLLAGVAAAK